jgi:uncharacterized protein (DUF1778 family)
MSTLESVPIGSHARLNCRVNARIKQQAEEAASLLGQSMTDFTESALAEKAQSVLERHERIVLSQRDFARFVERLETPEPPTPELQTAMAYYQTLKAAFPDAHL